MVIENHCLDSFAISKLYWDDDLGVDSDCEGKLDDLRSKEVLFLSPYKIFSNGDIGSFLSLGNSIVEVSLETVITCIEVQMV